MSDSVALASTTQTIIAPPKTPKPTGNQSKSTIRSNSNQSADPRSASILSPRQSDAILSLASTDGSKASTTQGRTETLSVPAAHRAYQDTFRSELIYSLPDDPDEGSEVDLPEISVGPGDSTDGGGSAPPSDSGGVTSPVTDNGGGGGDSSLQFTAVPVSDSDYATAFVSNPKETKFGDLNYGAVVSSGDSVGTNTDGSIYTDGTIVFKTANGTFQASPSTPGTYITATPVTNADGTAGMEITVNRGA